MYDQLLIAGFIITSVGWLLREILKKVKDKKNGTPNKMDVLLRKVSKIEETIPKINDLWNWHNVLDEDGVKIWYVRRSLEHSIEKLAENITVQTAVLQQLVLELKNMKRN